MAISVGTQMYAIGYFVERPDYLIGSIHPVIALASLFFVGRYSMRISMHVHPKYKPLVIDEERQESSVT